MSPGWQSNSLQIALSVENRIAFALPDLRFDKLAVVIPIAFAKSLLFIFLKASITSKWTMIFIIKLLNHFLPLIEYYFQLFYSLT